MEQKRQTIKAARLYLQMRGYQVLEENFRSLARSVDIIAKKSNTVYFVEVRYLSFKPETAAEPLSLKQIRHFQQASSSWLEATNWQGDFKLSVIELTGPDMTVLNFVDNAY